MRSLLFSKSSPSVLRRLVLSARSPAPRATAIAVASPSPIASVLSRRSVTTAMTVSRVAVESARIPTVLSFARSMFIQSRTTPNENSLMFLPGVSVLGEGNGTADFPSYRDAQKAPLAQELFKIDGVRSVLLGPDFVTITKKDESDWEVLRPEIHGAIMDFYQSGKEVIVDHVPTGSTVINEDDDQVVAMIKELLDTRIRPAVQEDGGDIQYVDFDDEGYVHLRLQGACSTCSSSQVTLKNGVENMLMHYIPEVQGVKESVTEEDEQRESASDEMLKRLETKTGTL